MMHNDRAFIPARGITNAATVAVSLHSGNVRSDAEKPLATSELGTLKGVKRLLNIRE